MTQIQALENLSQTDLVKLIQTERQQHADDMDMLSKELASRAFMVQGSIPESIHRLADEVVLANAAGNEDYQFETTQRLLKAIKNAPIEQLSVDLGHRMEGLANETPEPLLVQVYKINDISGSVDSDLSHPCTCSSGDGSLRWPCPVHPPETVNLTKSSNQQVSNRDKE